VIDRLGEVAGRKKKLAQSRAIDHGVFAAIYIGFFAR
jgi:hypothetical protein